MFVAQPLRHRQVGLSGETPFFPSPRTLDGGAPPLGKFCWSADSVDDIARCAEVTHNPCIIYAR